MDFESFKREFDKSFSQVDPNEFANKLEKLGYKFEDVSAKEDVFSMNFSFGIPETTSNEVNVFGRIWNNLFHKTIEANVQWHLTEFLVNDFESGATMNQFYEERKNIDFNYFKFQFMSDEIGEAVVKPGEKKVSILCEVPTVNEFNPTEEREAA